MPADASTSFSRRSFLGIADEAPGHISSLVVRAHPDRLEEVIARIRRIDVADVAASDRFGKIIVALETRDEDELVAAMNAMQQMLGVVSVALVYHQIEA